MYSFFMRQLFSKAASDTHATMAASIQIYPFEGIFYIKHTFQYFNECEKGISLSNLIGFRR